jgi:two-component system sensor histidine kinase PhoQ
LRFRSLRSRLLLYGGGVLLAALALVGLALNAANERAAVSSLQVQMESMVYQVLGAMEVSADGSLEVAEAFADPRLRQAGSGALVRVEGRNARWRSPSAVGEAKFTGVDVDPGQKTWTEPSGDDPWFTLAWGIGWQLEDESIEPFVVTVRVEQAELRRQTGAFRLGLWGALGGAALILVTAQALLFYFGFRPLREVAADVAEVESGRSERLQGRYPREIEPLARNVNRLLDTEKSNQARIRNALDSLAHSLKTPLAVIQAGLRPGDDASRQAVDEMSRLIATRLERAGSSARRTLAEPVPVEPQLQRLLRSLDKVHSRKMIKARCTLEKELAFYGEQRDLLELLGNLVDNAFKYGKSRVQVSGARIGSDSSRPGLWLRVDDDGPGIPADKRERLLQRGSRGDERVEGHGLGLAIVLELVTAYGGKVTIGDSDLGGASVRVDIPAA